MEGSIKSVLIQIGIPALAVICVSSVVWLSITGGIDLPIKSNFNTLNEISRKTAEVGAVSMLSSMKITAYSELDSCHYENCLTASGKPAYVGGIACPRSWKFGTRVLIGGEIFTCEDRYSKSLDERIDLFMGYGIEAYEQAIKFGVQEHEVEILEDSPSEAPESPVVQVYDIIEEGYPPGYEDTLETNL